MTVHEEERFARERLAGYRETILDASILLLGAGALGDAIATQLAMWGFGNVTVVDFDHYELSNATRVLDFPWARVREGERVFKAEHVAARIRDRVELAGRTARARAVVGWVQELEDAIVRSADVVIGALDHARARLDAARIARRYDKPIVVGGFDGEGKQVTIEQFPARLDAACMRCGLAEEPTYASASSSCTTSALRALEARALPATPTLAAACACFVVQKVVDGLAFGFPEAAQTLQIACAPKQGGSFALLAEMARDPRCGEHGLIETIAIRPRGDSLGALLDALEQVVPGAALSLPGPMPVHAVADDASCLLRVAEPAWRVRRRLTRAEYAVAPRGADAVVLDELNARLAERFGLRDAPARWAGPRPIAVRGSARWVVVPSIE